MTWTCGPLQGLQAYQHPKTQKSQRRWRKSCCAQVMLRAYAVCVCASPRACKLRASQGPCAARKSAWVWKRLTCGVRCEGLCYAYAGIAHSYLTSDFNDGTSVPKGLVQLDDLAAPSARASAAEHDGSYGTAQALSAAATTDGLLPDGAASLTSCRRSSSASSSDSGRSSDLADGGLFIERRYVDTRVELGLGA